MNANTEKNLDIKHGTARFQLRLFRPIIKEQTQTLPSRVNLDKNELVECLNNAKEELMIARANFDYADEEEMIDYYIYKIKACEIRYEYFLKKIKGNL